MKKLLLSLCAFFCFLFSAPYHLYAQVYTIVTIAGNGTLGYNGDGALAINSWLHNPYGICVDNVVNFYTADYYNNRIRKVNTAGIISTFAGNGTAGFSGDGGPATAAMLSQPADASWSTSGNLYIADEANNRIRMVSSAGTITTIAGTGAYTSTGDGGPATAATMMYPFGVLVDNSTGNIYIAEYTGARIRKINTSGIISTVAGTGTAGYSGDGGPATSAQLNAPLKIAIDPSGNLYIADAYNHRIRKVNTAGVISTFAGTGVSGFSGDGGPATSAQLNWPFGVGTDASGNVYICDFNNNRIRKVNTSGVITTIAGNGIGGFNGDGSPATSKELFGPSQITSSAAGNLYLSEYSNHRDRELTTGVLPISLISFTADYQKGNKSVECKWIAASQTNNQMFTIERSKNAQAWKEVGTIAGAGNLSFSADYSLTDYEPYNGISYYRLTQTDYDGNKTVYDPVAVYAGSGSESSFSLFPNPVSESATLVTYFSSADESFVITITDALGKTVSTLMPDNVRTGSNTYVINTSALSKGIYFLHVSMAAQESYGKFIKN